MKWRVCDEHRRNYVSETVKAVTNHSNDDVGKTLEFGQKQGKASTVQLPICQNHAYIPRIRAMITREFRRGYQARKARLSIPAMLTVHSG